MVKRNTGKPMTLDAGDFNEVKESAVMKDFKTEFEKNETKVPVTEVINYKRQVLDSEAQEKLDQYDQITTTNKALLKEKADLEAKIAEYIEEIATLKSEETKTLANADCNVGNAEVAELKREIEQLKSSTAQYLRRISDLTFENANLTAQLKELSSKSTQIQNTIPAMPTRETKLERAPYNPYLQNGYSSWN